MSGNRIPRLQSGKRVQVEMRTISPTPRWCRRIDIAVIPFRQLPDGIGFYAESCVTENAATWLRRLRGIPGLENPDPVMPHHRVGGRSIRFHHSCELARLPALQKLRGRAVLVMQALRHLFRRPFMARDGGAAGGALILLDVIGVRRSRSIGLGA